MKEIKIVCAECGKELNCYLSERDEVIEVAPCQKCLQTKYNKEKKDRENS